MITKDKITELFCILDEFSKNFDAEMQNHSLPASSPKARRRRKASVSDSEIMTVFDEASGQRIASLVAGSFYMIW